MREVLLATADAVDEVLAARVAGQSIVLVDPRLPTAEQHRRASFADREDARPSVVVFTSGTTVRARAVVLPWDELDACASAVIDAVDLRPGDRWVCPLPLTHVGGLAVLLRCEQVGATAVLEDFEHAVLGAQLASGATHVSLVGRMLARLLDEVPNLTAPALRLAMVGGGPTAPTLIERARAAGIPAVTTYGLTEAGSTVTLGRVDVLPTEAGDAGWPIGERDLRIAADGRIELRGPGLASRYDAVFSGGLSTRAEPDAFDPEPELYRDGWLTSGDFGRIESDGRLVVLDRRVDRIVTGGENVAPGEVEQVLASAPGVVEVCVVGVPDPQWGQRVVAAVRWAEEPRRDDLLACARARLLPWQRPRQIVDWDGAFPRGGLGKLQRRRVRDKLVELVTG